VYGSDSVFISGDDGCVIKVQPYTWAWQGTRFYFQSAEDVAVVNDCFTSGTHLIDIRPPPTVMPSTFPTLQPSIFTNIPNGVVLLRDDNPCVFEGNRFPQRFLCTIQPTTPNEEPSVYGSDSVFISGEKDSCVIEIQPYTWAWQGTRFYFQSAEDIAVINGCFTPGTRLTEFHSWI